MQMMLKKMESAILLWATAGGGGGDLEPTMERAALGAKVAAVALAAWLSSGMATQLVKGFIPVVPPSGSAAGSDIKPALVAEGAKPLDYYAPVWEKSVFNPGGSVSTEVSDEMATEAAVETPIEDIPLSSLNYQLIGTVAGPPAYAFAIIRTPAQREQGLYRTSDMVGPASITRIERNRVILDNNGREEMLEVKFDDAASVKSAKAGPASVKGVTKVAADRYILDRKEVDRLSGDMSQFMTQVRVVPNMDGGKASGYKLLNIKPGSLVESVGMKDGDIVREINGRPIDKPEEAFVAYQQLKGGGGFTIDLDRGGKRETIRYEIR